MEFHCQITKSKGRIRRIEKLSLDDYLSFVSTHKQIDLTVNLLNQVIHMHGFKKIHQTPKKVLIDALNSIDLMDPSRSTRNDEHVSSFAFINLEEAIQDLVDLNWQECCVTSIETVNSVNYGSVLQNANDSQSNSKPKRMRKRRKLSKPRDIDVVGDGSGVATAAAQGWGGSRRSRLFRSPGAVSEGDRSMELVQSNVRGGADFSATVGDFSEATSSLLAIVPC